MRSETIEKMVLWDLKIGFNSVEGKISDMDARAIYIHVCITSSILASNFSRVRIGYRAGGFSRSLRAKCMVVRNLLIPERVFNCIINWLEYKGAIMG